MPTPYYGPPDSWYQPDPDEYSEADIELAYDTFIEDEGREPDTDSKEWADYLEWWIDNRNKEAEYARYGL